MSDEQAGHVMAHLEPMVSTEEAPQNGASPGQQSNIQKLSEVADRESATAFAQKIGVGLGGVDDSVNPPGASEETPQF